MISHLRNSILLLCLALPLTAAPLRILSYNVENLFYPEPDSTRVDEEFTPDGARHWSFTRYRRKLAHVAEVMVLAGEWEMPAVVGLQEVEEARCLSDLCTYYLRSHRYRYIHYDGTDVRGIDVAMIYDTTQLTLLSSRPIPVVMPAGERPTRDVLYAVFRLPDSTMLHVLNCHLPSQLGGSQASAIRREAAYGTLRIHTDSILLQDSQAKIVIMGDFNSEPLQVLEPMINLMLALKKPNTGTEKYHGKWSLLDQFFVSPAMAGEAEARILDAEFLLEPDEAYLGMRPKRTYQGYHYRKDGYSDHLPILLEWTRTQP